MANKGTILSDETREKIRANRARQVHPRLAARGITLADVQKAAGEGKRWCCGCIGFVDMDQFSGSKPTQCRKCVARSVSQVRERWTPEQRAEMAENISAWRFENETHVRRKWLNEKYGVTPEWYETTLAEQGGHCAMCEETEFKNRKFMCVDHNHATGKARGILCYKCNTFIGQIENCHGLAERAIAYLAHHS